MQLPHKNKNRVHHQRSRLTLYHLANNVCKTAFPPSKVHFHTIIDWKPSMRERLYYSTIIHSYINIESISQH